MQPAIAPPHALDPKGATVFDSRASRDSREPSAVGRDRQREDCVTVTPATNSTSFNLRASTSILMFAGALVAVLAVVAAAAAQPVANTNAAAATAAQGGQAEAAKDALGRDTPRGTLLGFMNAARGGSDELGPQFLNTRLRAGEAVDLAHKLFVVLDSRLPARLNEVSERPEGSLANPLKPNQDIIGSVETADGRVDILVERVTRARTPQSSCSRGPHWRVPAVYDEVDRLLGRHLRDSDQAPDWRYSPVRVAGVFPSRAALLPADRCARPSDRAGIAWRGADGRPPTSFRDRSGCCCWDRDPMAAAFVVC